MHDDSKKPDAAQPVAWRYWNEKSKSWNTTTSTVVADVMRESGRAVESLFAAPQASAMDFAEPYEGAREDLAIWTRRALEAERDLRAERETSSRLGAALNAENGPMHLGEPVLQASAEGVRNAALEEAAAVAKRRPQIRLQRGERIIAVVPEYAAGPGWSNMPLWVYIDSQGKLHTECIQPDQQTHEQRYLFSVGATITRQLIASVETQKERGHG